MLPYIADNLPSVIILSAFNTNLIKKYPNQ